MFRLTLSTVRTRKLAFAGALASVVVAVALVAACVIMIQSGLSGTPEVDRYAATAALVRPDQMKHLPSTDGDDSVDIRLDPPPVLTDEQVAELRAVPGVEIVVDAPFPAQAVDRRGVAVPGLSWGHGWAAARLTPFTLASGRAPGDGEVVLDAALARRVQARPGDSIQVVTAEGARRFRVSGVARLASGRDALPTQSSLFFDTATSARLSRGPLAAGVLARPGEPAEAPAEAPAARVRAVARSAGLEVLTGDERARAGAPETAEQLDYTTQLFGPMAGVGGFLAVFVIGGTFGLSMLQRRREIALLRAIGTTAGQIRRMIAGEAVLVAVVAAVPGYLLGVRLAHLLRGVLVARGLAPPELVVVTGPLPLFVAGGAGLVLTSLSALTAVRQAAAVRPAEALREAALSRRLLTVPRLLSALAMLGGGAAILALSQHLGGELGVAFQALVVILLMAAAALLAPLATRLLLWPVGTLAGAVTRMTGGLAYANSVTAVRRASSAAAAIMLSVAMAGYALLVNAVLADTTAAQGRARVVADQVLLPGGGAELPASVAAAVARRPGVETVSAVRRTSFVLHVLGDPESVPAQIVDPGTAGRVLDLGFVEGSLEGLKTPGTVAVSRAHAGANDWHVGSEVRGWLADGTAVKLRVAGVFERSLGFADVLLPGRPGAGPAGAVLVKAGPGADLTGLGPAARVVDAGAYAADVRTSIEDNVMGTYLVLAVLVSFTALSLVNTLVMGTATRTREFALLRAVGASRWQIVRMMGWETAIVTVIGAVMGTAVACVVLAGANGALTGTMTLTGLPVPQYPLMLAAVAVLSLAAGSLASGMALLPRPADALGGARE
ncbi:FtsX-like permease family protein [Nonomuraea angiospora]|uniref:FtsX-like permease family protein n=1 Tax=Nonomuraea angiospora TaxID=46172 RepID=UPI0033F94F63